MDTALDNVNHPLVQQFSRNYVGYDLPEVSAVRRTVLPKIYESCVDEMRVDVGVDPDTGRSTEAFWFSIDGTTNIIGR